MENHDQMHPFNDTYSKQRISAYQPNHREDSNGETECSNKTVRTNNLPTPPVEPHIITEEKWRGADSCLQKLIAADYKLIQIFGDTIHHNDGLHLTGDVPMVVDQSWQQ